MDIAKNLPNKESVLAIASSYNNITTLEAAIVALNNFYYVALTGLGPRYAWVYRSLIVYKLLSGMTPKKRTETIKKLGFQMHYGKSQMYKFRAAGEKLIKGDFETLPLTINDFMS